MKKFLAVLLSAMMVFSLAACSNGGGDGGQTDGGAKSYDIVVWASEVEGVTDQFKEQIARFNEQNEDVNFNVTIEGISESEAATQMITDVESGPDLYCFAQDQLARLVQAGALAVLGEGASATVTDANDTGSVAAATVGGKIYCYPMTSDNGYFLYYDKSVIADDQVSDLATLVKACEDAGKFFSMQFKGSAWYNAAFFFGAGCVSEWVTAPDGSFTSVNDTFNSDAGLAAMKGMEILAKSPAANDSSEGSDFSKGSAAVVTGTWAANDIKGILGDNMGVAELPSFTVDGQTYHMGSFSGYKLIGVKPQVDAERASALQRLALYLTSEECQLERFNKFGWGPSNKAAQNNDAVKADPTLVALAAQNAYAVPQGQIHGSWWDIAKVLGTVAQDAKSDDDLKAGLQAYEDAINALFSIDGYVFVGAWNEWNNADQGAAKMTQDGENLSITLDVPESDYMGGRIVAAGDWGTDMGCQQVTEGADLIVPYDEASNGDNNIIFLAAGNYTVTANTSSKEIKIVKN